MDKKIIFFDVDGTLIDHEKNEIPPSSINSIKQLQDNGHTVVIATGKVPYQLDGVEKLLGIDSYVCGNGSYVVLNGEEIYNKAMSRDTLKRLVEKCNDRELEIGFENVDNYVVHKVRTNLVDDFTKSYNLANPTLDEQFHLDNDVLQCVLYTDKEDYDDFIEEFPEFNFLRSNEYGLDVHSKDTHKDTGVKIILEKLGFNPSDAYAFGDGLNDIGMLKMVGHGIAMGNARQALKDIADFVTKDVNDNGIEYALKHYELI